MADHPDRNHMEQFARGQLAVQGEVWVLAHLDSRCAVCRRTMDQVMWDWEKELALGDAPAPASRRHDDEAAWAKVIATMEERWTLIRAERVAAPRLLQELRSRSAEDRLAAARADQRFHTLALCELLIDTSFHDGFSDAEAALGMAEVALAVARHLDQRHYGCSLVQDLRARAWAFLGNARRINFDLSGATDALDIAERLAEEGSADPLEEARILDLKAALLCDRGLLDEAAEALDQIIDIYEDVRDLHRKGNALIRKGLFLGHAGSAEDAIELIEEGLSLIDWQQEPRLELLARHGKLAVRTDSGRAAEAGELLARLRQTCSSFPEAWTEIGLRWQEGRIAARCESYAAAECAFKEVRQRCVEKGFDYNAALATLDLARLYLTAGRKAEVMHLTGEMLPIFLSQDVRHNALAALVAFKAAVEGGFAPPE